MATPIGPAAVIAPLNPEHVTAYAKLTLAVWREESLTDAEILAICGTPDPDADAVFEAGQVEARGYVFAPAAAVKAAMQTLIVG